MMQKPESGLASIENSWCFKTFMDVWNTEIPAPGLAISNAIARAPSASFIHLLPVAFTPDNMKKSCAEDIHAVIRVARELRSHQRA